MRLGVLDIGSNTVHLLLVDAHTGATPVPFASFKRPLQLVAFLDKSGAITEAGQRELLAFIAGAIHFAEQNGAEDLLAFATSAIREAANGEAVLARVHNETGLPLVELSGREEAAATFFAVRRWYGWGAGTILNLDIGGGSFELALGADEAPAVAVSVPLGAGRITRSHLDVAQPTAAQVAAAREHIRDTLAGHVPSFSHFGSPTIVAGSSKSFRSLARIAGAPDPTAGIYAPRQLTRRDLGRWVSRLASMSLAERTKLPGVSQVRARQLLAAALIAEEAMTMLDIEVVRICPWALREGLILRRFDQLSAVSV